MRTFVLWGGLATLIGAAYLVWSAPAMEGLYLQAWCLARIETWLGVSHRLTVLVRPGRPPERAFVEEVVQYFASFSGWGPVVRAQVQGAMTLGLTATLAVYGAVGPAIRGAGIKRHVRGAQIPVYTRWSPGYRRVGFALALGFLFAVGLWAAMVALEAPPSLTFAAASRQAFLPTRLTGVPTLRDLTEGSVLLGYLLAIAAVLAPGWLKAPLGEIARRRQWRWPQDRTQVGGLRFTFEEETRGFLIAGRPGAGKTLTIQTLLRAFRKRGVRAITADPDGGYVSRFFHEGDAILNPLDRRSRRWSPFAEIRTDADFDGLAKAVIPESDHATEEEWRRFARDLLAAVMRRLQRDGRARAAEVLRTINNATDDELAVLVAGTHAAGLRRHDALFNSVLGVLSSHIRGWQTLVEPDLTHPAFSIRDWVQNRRGSQAQALYLTYIDRDRESLKPLIATWLSLALSEMLSLPETRDDRLLCVLDELDSLGRVGELQTSPTMLRKHGVVLIIGLHTKAQPDRTYGLAGAQVIITGVGHKLILGLGDHETATYFEKELGLQEVERVRSTHGSGVTARGLSRSRSVSRDSGMEPPVMASELMGLKDRDGYLRRAGSNAIYRFTVPLVLMPRIADPFIERE